MRLDILASQKLGTSREKAKKLILNGKITVNGTMQKVPKFETNEADEILCSQEIVQISNEILPNFGVELKVIFEDEHILVINKQKGLMVHEGASENFHTIATLFDSLNEYAHPKVHRCSYSHISNHFLLPQHIKATKLVDKLQGSVVNILDDGNGKGDYDIFRY